MCDCFPSTPIPLYVSKFGQLRRPHKTLAFPNCRWKLSNATRTGRSFQFLCPSVLGSEDYGSPSELGFEEKAENPLDFEANRGEEKQNNRRGGGRRRRDGHEAISSEFLELQGDLEDDQARLEDENLVRVEDGNGHAEEKLVSANGRMGMRKGRQVMRRSSLLAKQVISIRTAFTLGFVSQLWVDSTSWVVLFVEVRPNLLSGECERFLLEDVSQVGDVVLVEDETVIESEFKMVGLETLVGYKVVTPGQRNIGKVRGYTFNISSGAIESLELDSFGISIIPSSLVSTYALLVEDVLEVLSDAVVVHEAAASRIQRLTKGFLDSQNVGISVDSLREYSDFERPLRSERRSRNSGSQKFRGINRDIEEDWELPMDYL